MTELSQTVALEGLYHTMRAYKASVFSLDFPVPDVVMATIKSPPKLGITATAHCPQPNPAINDLVRMVCETYAQGYCQATQCDTEPPPLDGDCDMAAFYRAYGEQGATRFTMTSTEAMAIMVLWSPKKQALEAIHSTGNFETALHMLMKKFNDLG